MIASYLDKLKQSGLKITPKRKAIISFFLRRNRYFTPEVVWKNLRKDFGHLGLPSVYRNLELFEEKGICMKVHRSDRRLCYALANGHGDCQYQIICVECEKVEELPGDYLPERKQIQGFKILKHRLQVEGICPNCGKETAHDR